jgi:hypothetical protein
MALHVSQLLLLVDLCRPAWPTVGWEYVSLCGYILSSTLKVEIVLISTRKDWCLMPTATLRRTWRGRIRGLLRDAFSDLQALTTYNAKPAVQLARPLFTPAELTIIADAQLILTAKLVQQSPR